MSEHFEDSMGQQELPCDKCGTFCYLVDKVDACDAQRLVAEVLRLRVLLNAITDIALKEMQFNDDNPPMNNILNLAYKGVIE
tara:strand:+ start:1214 stop:1459 length:246 start_codon:yes stop_codon:yes gene_type:complete